MSQSIYELEFNLLDGQAVRLSEYRGKLLLIVNTASECGFTPQYAGLQSLWEDYKDRGLMVIGFPCNQFGGQEPGNEATIGAFCQRNYGVTFPMASKVEVNGDNAHPLFKYLTEVAPGVLKTRVIKWNFTKFLVSKDGTSAERFAPTTTPNELRPVIESWLAR
jgi:glutathione peroxidase